MQGLGREGELHSQVVGQADDIHEQTVLLLKLRGPVRRLPEHVQQDIQGAGGKLVEIDVEIIFAGVGMNPHQFPDPLTEGFDSIRRRVVGDRNHAAATAVGAHSKVVHLGVYDDAVRQADQGVVKGPYPGVAESHVFHRALGIADNHPVANSEGLVHQDHDTAEDVGQQVFGRQGESQTSDSQAGQQAAHLYVQVLGDEDQAEGHHENLKRATHHGNQQIIKFAFGL